MLSVLASSTLHSFNVRPLGTMVDEFKVADDRDGPSAHVVSLARFWLVVMGLVWMAVGFVIVLRGAEMWGWPGSIVAVGALHFLAVRYASNRLAVFLALFGP